MKKIDKLSVSLFFLLLALTLAGCGGQTAQPEQAANPASPAPSPAPSPVPSPTPSAAPSNAKTIANIQKLSGWQTCSGACSATAPTVFSMTQGVASPSLSGASARFQLLSGTSPFGGALWFKFLGAADSATHFVFDLYFYMDNPSAPQALEFNVSQSTGGSRYEFSTQCEMVNTRSWRVWDPVAKKWAATAAPCVQPPPKVWNHLVWELERNSSGQVVFTAVTLNGNRSQVNVKMGRTADSQSGIDIGFQLDANRTATPYSVWLDKVSLTYW
jgi:hypothetical protein